MDVLQQAAEALSALDVAVKVATLGKLREAIQMDIDDIQSKFGSKYDGHITQMLGEFGFPE